LGLIRYPVRTDIERVAESDAEVWVERGGERCTVMGAPHVDSGFLTLLAQDGVGGLQARHRSQRADTGGGLVLSKKFTAT